MSDRLAADLWVKAYIRRCFVAGRPAMLRRRGDAHGGTVLIKVNLLDGRAKILSPSFDGEGGRLWLSALGAEPVSDTEAEAYAEKRLARDPDIWLIELEAADGDPLLDEPVA